MATGLPVFLFSATARRTSVYCHCFFSIIFMEEKCKADVIKDYFPELTPTELVVAALILQDKTVGDICKILHRSSGNITSHRSNIRTKLGLSKTENLKAALRLRVRLHEFPDCGN